MTGHASTAVAGDMQGLVFRAIYSCRNAEFQFQAQALGTITPLHNGEIARAGALNAMANVTTRTWEYWTMRLERAGDGLAPAQKTRPEINAKKQGKTKRRKR